MPSGGYHQAAGTKSRMSDPWLLLTRLTPTRRETFLLLKISHRGSKGAGSYVVLPVLSDKDNGCRGALMAAGIKDGLGKTHCHVH